MEVARERYPAQISSGVERLDRLMGDVERSDLIVIASRPTLGKSTLALNFALHSARNFNAERPSGASVAIFSLEVSESQLKERLREISGAASEKTGAVEDESSSLKIVIDDTPQINLAKMKQKVRECCAEGNVGLVVVDYIQLIQDSRNTESTEIAQELKAIASELEVPVIVLSQLPRSVEQRQGRPPKLEDLNEMSNGLAELADFVLFLTPDSDPSASGHRDDVFASGEIASLSLEVGTKIILAKKH